VKPIKWPQPKNVKTPLVMPELGELEKVALQVAMETGQIGAISEKVPFVEKKLDEIFGLRCLLVSNGSVALILALRSAGINHGDKVITSNLTYAATASSIVNVGAVPVFCDVELESWQISLESVKRMYTDDCRAIIIPHIYGVAADMDPIMEFANQRGLTVIEDCAETFLGEYQGVRLGSIGELSTFSFFPNKLITCGEGGMVATKSLNSHEKMKILRGQGMDPEYRYWFLEAGYNFRITGLQASILGAQIERIQTLWHLRESSEESYRSVMKDFLGWPSTHYEIKRSPWIFTGTLNDRDEEMKLAIASDLAEIGVESRPVFYPLSKMPAFAEYPADLCRNSESISSRGISLPTGNHVKKEELEKIHTVFSKYCNS
jgi:perosamine synthetase